MNFTVLILLVLALAASALLALRFVAAVFAPKFVCKFPETLKIY